MINQFKSLIKNSQKILITSHISPDPDSVCSTLLLAQALQSNFSDKEVVINLEELPEGLEFLKGFERIHNKPLDESLRSFRPDLFIILDANSFARCTRPDAG